ncbi:MAG: citrate lyase subunit beta / citryl-CoA lyase [Gammaproteobacteria bacterium]|nr:citrate lyase subunit beta / citryl-CoA lyase [Gammaproteobacteria bacterium]
MMPSARPRRTALYLPAHSARAVEKARSVPCDVVILDLEDAVGPNAKLEARPAAVEAVRRGGFGHREVVIRTNGLSTPWGLEDLAAAAQAKPHGVLVPKIAAASDLRAARAALGDSVPLWAMIETCAAMLRLHEIGAAGVETGVEVWVIGSNDLVKEMRCAHSVQRPGLQTSLSMSVMAARAFGVAILDGVFNEVSDADGLATQCAQGVDLGFDGKTVIHPNQLDITNKAFTPNEAAIAWARTVISAFDRPENAGLGILTVEGRMVERLHYDEARRLIQVAEAIAAVGR